MRKSVILVFWMLLPFSAAYAQRAGDAVVRYEDLRHPVLGASGMVAAQNALAAEVGATVLADGGNAVDAAVAIGFSLAVTLPSAGNLGGGGFMLVHDAEANETTAIDYREMAPPRATRDMFLDAEGNADPGKSRFSLLAAGVPGTVAGMHLAHRVKKPFRDSGKTHWWLTNCGPSVSKTQPNWAHFSWPMLRI